MRSTVSSIFSRRSIILITCITVILMGLIVGVTSARADIAPPKAPPGANPEVNEITQVRMMDEKVVLTIQEKEDVESMGSARVWAEFHMMNLGDKTEALMVRFPISYNDGWGEYPEIEDLMVYVNNDSVPISIISLEGDPEVWDDPIKWTEFEVVFPPGEMVEIEVDYTLYGTGYYPYVTYGYLLETGAGWKGTIGSAEIIVRLPYEVNESNILLGENTGWGGTTPDFGFSEKEVIWYFEDLEPGSDNNISIAIIWPSIWQRILDEERFVSDFPEDGEAWGRLAKHYKEVSRFGKGFREDPGGEWLHELSIKAYEKALELLPNDALWHAGYADLLLWRSSWEYHFTAETREEYLEGLYQMYLAYKLDPDQEYIQNYLNNISLKNAVEEANGEFVFTWLTQTPTLAPVEHQETAAPQTDPTSVALISATPQPEPSQPPGAVSETEASGDENIAEKKSLPFCGSAILFPFGLIVVVAIPKIRSKKNR